LKRREEKRREEKRREEARKVAFYNIRAPVGPGRT
jgi:hypothetical protein